MKFFISLFALLVINIPTYSQKYGMPVEVPISLSSNFAEVRPNHFHSGIDIKMAIFPISKRGVLSTADGYVSRIYVNPYGFGKAIYIYHPSEKTTSVYGHLDCFSDEITKIVREEQYRKKSFAINYFLKENQLKVKKGDKIGVAGNSGISGGIHLHYELRNPDDEPINLITEGLIKVEDNIPPAIVSVSIVDIDTIKGATIYTNRGRYVAKKISNGQYVIDENITIDKPSYLTIEYIDRKNGVSNSFGIYQIDASINKTPYFNTSLDKINFGTTRYVNSFSEYYKNRASAYSVARLYVSPNNKLKIYGKVKNNGILDPKKLNKENDVEIKLTDDSKNISVINLKLSKKEATPKQCVYNFNKNSYVVRWDKETCIKNTSANLSIPLGAFYDTDIIDFYCTDGTSPYSKNVCLKNVYIPTQEPMTLEIKDTSLPEKLRSKALVVRVNSAGNKSSAGGKWENGYVKTSIRDNGVYAISIDTTPPTIVSKQEQGSTIKGSKIQFTIRDNLSGISSVSGYVDGEWEVFDFDGKSALIAYDINKDGTECKRHDIKIDITDGKGNKRAYQTHYYW